LTLALTGRDPCLHLRTAHSGLRPTCKGGDTVTTIPAARHGRSHPHRRNAEWPAANVQGRRHRHNHFYCLSWPVTPTQTEWKVACGRHARVRARSHAGHTRQGRLNTCICLTRALKLKSVHTKSNKALITS